MNKYKCIVCNDDADFMCLDGNYLYCFQCIHDGKAQ